MLIYGSSGSAQHGWHAGFRVEVWAHVALIGSMFLVQICYAVYAPARPMGWSDCSGDSEVAICADIVEPTGEVELEVATDKVAIVEHTDKPAHAPT